MKNDPEDPKQIMTKTLKSFVVPEIKALNYSGSFPHFRRERDGRFEFVSFQFNRHGGSFVLECGFATPHDLPDFAKKLQFEKLTSGNAHPDNRLRITPKTSVTEDFWFAYSEFKEEKQFENLAKSLIPLLPNIEKFFRN